MAVRKVRSRPVEAEALQFHPANWRECEEFGAELVKALGNWRYADDVLCLEVRTGNTFSFAMPGQWLVKDGEGALSVLTPDAFAELYEPAAAVTQAQRPKLPEIARK